MEITIEINKWGFGFYSPWAGFDFTWGIAAVVVAAVLVNKIIKKYNLPKKEKSE